MNFQMCSSRNACTNMFASVPFWKCPAASAGHSTFAKAPPGGPLLGASLGPASRQPRVEGCVFGGSTDCPGHHQMAGCGGRYGLSRSNEQPPGCPPRCPTELPRSNSVMLSGLVGQALAIGITRVEGALVFLLWGAAFFLLDAPSRCAGTVVLGAWMAWTSRPAPPDGLSWCLDDPSQHDPASNPV